MNECVVCGAKITLKKCDMCGAITCKYHRSYYAKIKKWLCPKCQRDYLLGGLVEKLTELSKHIKF